MDQMIQRLKFRRFSYETDPEYIVDMHRCHEVLEGGWFDSEETCRHHHKIVTFVNGSTWVGAIANAIVGYVDLLELAPETGLVSRWRLHPDFHHPRVARKMLEGLFEQAKKHQFRTLVFYADLPEVVKDLEMIGIPKDRCYKWANLGDAEEMKEIEGIELDLDRYQLMKETFLPFLGAPLPTRYIIARAFMAADYGIFNFRKPQIFEIRVGNKPFFGCFDGREWYVFRREKHPEDGEAIKGVLAGLAKVADGKILLSGKALEKSGITPASDEAFWDLFTDKIK